MTTRKHTVASGSLVVDLSILNRRRKQILRFCDILLDIGLGRLKKKGISWRKNHLIFISSWPIAYCFDTPPESSIVFFLNNLVAKRKGGGVGVLQPTLRIQNKIS